jgi:hypothetical protein
MPAGGGDPKVLGDGQVVSIRPEFGRGNSDIWDMKDVLVALLEEREDFRTMVAGAADFAAFKTGVGALDRWVIVTDSLVNIP